MSSGPDFCGWGAKQGSKVRTWKNRYFVLYGRDLIYYSGAKSDGSGAGISEKGRLRVVNVNYSPDRKNGLLIYGENKKLKMTTANAQDSRLLFRKIKQAIGEQEKSFCFASLENHNQSVKKEGGDGAFTSAVESSSLALERVGNQEIEPVTETELIALKYTTANDDDWTSDPPSPRDNQPERTQLPSFPRNVPQYQQSNKSKDPSTAFESLQSADSHRVLSPSIAGADQCIKYGWLHMQRNERSSWLLRYFVLQGKTLYCYQQVNGTSETLGNVSNVRYNKKEPTGFHHVEFQDGSAVNVYGETKADMDAWYAAFCKASWNKAANSAPKDASLNPEEVEAGTSFRGWLLKKGQHFQTWKRRYFVLENSRLAYSATATSEVLGSGVVFEVQVGTLRPFCLNIRFQNGQLLHVVAPTAEAFAKWFDVLERASNLSLSFLSQSHEKRIVEEEFDHDEGENATDVEVEFTDDDLAEYEVSLREAGGASLWIAAMQNKPEYDTRSSSSSDQEVVETELVSEDTRPSSVSRPSEPHRCTGWLLKEGRKVKNWKRRFFMLYDSTLSYYKSESGSLLRSVEVVGVQEHSSVSDGLLVSTGSGRKLLLQADSRKEVERWFQALRDAVSGKEKDRMENTLTTTGNVFKEEVNESSSHSGWLEKEGQHYKSWKKRYFTLKNGALIYYREIGGVARGHGIVKDVSLDDSKLHTLVIGFRCGKTMRVTAASQEDMDAWLEAFSHDRSSSERTTEVSDVTSDEQGARISRFDSTEYLNDPISHDTFMRLYDEKGKATVLEAGVHLSRSFKGELTFGEEEEKKEVEEEEEDLGISITGAQYYRHLLAEDERIHEERAAAQKSEPPLSGCTPCCIVM